MTRRFEGQLRTALVILDAAIAVAVLALVWVLSHWNADPLEPLLQAPFFSGAYAVAAVSLFWLNGLYRPRARWALRSEVFAVVEAIAWLAFGTLALIVFLKLSDVGRLYLVLLFPVHAAFAILVRAALRVTSVAFRERGRNLRNVLVLGTGDAGRAMAARLDGHSELGLRVIGFLGETPRAALAWPHLGPIDDLEVVLHGHAVDEVAICLPFEQRHLIDGVARISASEGKIVRIPLEMPQLSIAHAQFDELEGMPILSLVAGPDHALGLALKRAIDLAISALALVVLSPLFLGVAIAIRLVDGSPVLFRQERAGLNGRRFQIVKFRTMERDADARRAQLRVHNELKGNASFKMTNDPRITPLGRWLRRTSIDELPQLWNVLLGEMSLVGPRPHPLDDVAGYQGWHWRRLSMKPGITGLWQIGSRRETDFDRWVEKDLEYIDRWSLLLDLRVLLRTIPALLRAEGR